MDAFFTSRAMSDLLTGLVSGVVTGLVALSLVLIWRSTHILNFAAGAMATFAAYLGMGLTSYGVGYWWCLVLVVVFGMLVGAATEVVLVRPLYGKPELNPIVVMVGLLLLLESVTGAIWSTNPRPIPLPFSFIDWRLGGDVLKLSPNDVFHIVLALSITLLIATLFRFTNLGLQLRAAAVAPEVARLLGVRVRYLLTLGWGLSAAVGAVAAVLVGSGLFGGLSPSGMEVPFALGFLAAAVGGLDSPSGAMLVGVLFGVMVTFVEDYVNANSGLLVALGVLVVVLMIRPQGIFARRTVRRV